MKKILSIGVLLPILILISCVNQNAKEILKKSYEKCQSIENGYYEMIHYVKYMSGNDTTFSNYNCYFKKLADDTNYSSSFHYQYFIDGKYSGDRLYTGDDFVKYSRIDSIGYIMSKTVWAEKIKSISHNHIFYSPLTNKKSSPLLSDDALDNENNNLQFMGEEMINGYSCFHIKLNIIPKNDDPNMPKILRIENNFWINKQDYIPVQYSLAIDLVMNNEKMYQFEKSVLTKYELNNLRDDEKLKLSSIPSCIFLKDYQPNKRPDLLPKDTVAPKWSLISLDDKPVKLTDIKGQLVLIDFFYKSCYPCIKALPALQNLHKRYYDKGLRIIGINPYDSKEDDIDNFLSKHGVTYTVLLGGKDVAKEYNVFSYPTIYLIDRNGKVLFTQVGYGEGTEAKLEEIIKQNL